MKRYIVALLGSTLSLLGQGAAPMPQPEVQFFDNLGEPLVGGKVCTYLANTNIALATFVDASGTTPNPNPIILDSAGRASIWATTSGQKYKMVLKSGGDGTCNTGTTLWSQDNIPINGSSGGGGGGGSSSLNAIYVVQTSSGASGAGGYIDLPQITYPNSTCLDIYGNVVNIPKPPTGAPAFGALDVILWNSTSPLDGTNPPGCATALPTLSSNGLNTNARILSQGGFASSSPSSNAFDALNGGFRSLNGGYTMGQGLYGLPHAACAGLNPPANPYGGFAYAGGSVWCYYDATAATWNTVDLAGGGGGGGGASGPGKAVQYTNDASPFNFHGSSNFTFDPTLQLLTVKAVDASHASIVALTGFIQSEIGLLVQNSTIDPTTPVPWNAIQAPYGGLYGLSLSAKNFTQTGLCCGTVGSPTSGPPPLTTGISGFRRGDMYWDLATAAELVYNGTAWVSLGGGSGSSVGAAGAVQLSGGGGVFAANAFLYWDTPNHWMVATSSGAGTAGITVTPGFVQADAGFLAVDHITPANALPFNTIQAPTGGMEALSFTAANYVQLGHGAYSGTTGPIATTSDTFHKGAITYNDTAGCFWAWTSGSAWGCINTGGGSPAGTGLGEVQFNIGGAFTASSRLVWDNSLFGLTVTTPTVTPGLKVLGGYMQADQGFLATSGVAANWNVIQAPTGGVAGRSMRAQKYVGLGFSGGIPAVTNGDSFNCGDIYYETVSDIGLRVYDCLGTPTWKTIPTGGSGVLSINGSTGAITISGTANQISTNTFGTTITLSTPQNINTTANVQFGTVSASTTLQSSATGSTVSFQNANNNFIVDGSGNITSSGVLHMAGFVAGVNVTGSTASNSIQTSGGITAAQNVTANGGIATPVGTNSTIAIGTGSLYIRTFTGGAPICGGISDGWLALNLSNLSLYVCAGGVEWHTSPLTTP